MGDIALGRYELEMQLLEAEALEDGNSWKEMYRLQCGSEPENRPLSDLILKHLGLVPVKYAAAAGQQKQSQQEP